MHGVPLLKTTETRKDFAHLCKLSLAGSKPRPYSPGIGDGCPGRQKGRASTSKPLRPDRKMQPLSRSRRETLMLPIALPYNAETVSPW